MGDLLAQTLERIRPPDAGAMAEARERQARLTKPAGSLGELENLGVRLAGLAGRCPPPVPAAVAVAVFAGDHGVHAAGVTPWPQEVTAQMVANFRQGGAVVNAFARQCDARVTVVDVGVATDLPEPPADAVLGSGAPGFVAARVRRGTRDFSREPALTRHEVIAAIEVGIWVAGEQVAAGAQLLVGGDMGIANTTPAAALVATFTGASPAQVTGRGTGIDDAMLDRKRDVVAAALQRYAPEPGDPIGVLAAVGGLEHAALTGYMLAAAAHRTPVVVDGVIACSAALAAVSLHPDVGSALVAGHRSAEPGATTALATLGLTPLLDLGLRLGEGTGALLAVPLVSAAARVLSEVATFDSAGVARK
jgi:nicotinate-nucleotide--dimethylbenzimidazole phosphoribosyltransferase